MGPIEAVVARIKIPAEALLPIAIGIVALLVLIFAASALRAWKRRNPKAARTTGIVIGAICTLGTVVLLIRLMPLTNSRELGRLIQGLPLDESILVGVFAALAAAMWRFGDQRWVGGAVGAVTAACLIAKPYAIPLTTTWGGEVHVFSPTSETHLFLLGPGVALAVIALIVALKQPAAVART